jgi:hypothetical protein
VAQSVVLTSQLIAFFDEPRLLGPFGVALGPRHQHQRTQRCDLVGLGEYRYRIHYVR